MALANTFYRYPTGTDIRELANIVERHGDDAVMDFVARMAPGVRQCVWHVDVPSHGINGESNQGQAEPSSARLSLVVGSVCQKRKSGLVLPARDCQTG